MGQIYRELTDFIMLQIGKKPSEVDNLATNSSRVDNDDSLSRDGQGRKRLKTSSVQNNPRYSCLVKFVANST